MIRELKKEEISFHLGFIAWVEASSGRFGMADAMAWIEDGSYRAFGFGEEGFLLCSVKGYPNCREAHVNWAWKIKDFHKAMLVALQFAIKWDCKILTAELENEKLERLIKNYLPIKRNFGMAEMTDIDKLERTNEGLLLKTKILTPDGIKTASELVAGDLIFGKEGKLVSVKKKEYGLSLTKGKFGGGDLLHWENGAWAKKSSKDYPCLLVLLEVTGDHSILLADGTVVHNKGGDAQATTSKVEPWKEAQPFLIDLYKESADAMSSLRAQDQGSGGDAIRALAEQNASGSMLMPESNPALMQQFDSLRGQGQRTLAELFPKVGSQANLAGAFGGSRQGVAEGIAARGVMNNVNETIAGLTAQNYATERANQLKAGDLFGQALGLDSNYANRGLNEQSAILNGGSFSTQTQTAPGTSVASGAMGGAMMGAQLGSVVPGLGTGIGAVAGGILGAFS